MYFVSFTYSCLAHLVCQIDRCRKRRDVDADARGWKMMVESVLSAKGVSNPSMLGIATSAASTPTSDTNALGVESRCPTSMVYVSIGTHRAHAHSTHTTLLPTTPPQHFYHTTTTPLQHHCHTHYHTSTYNTTTTLLPHALPHHLRPFTHTTTTLLLHFYHTTYAHSHALEHTPLIAYGFHNYNNPIYLSGASVALATLLQTRKPRFRNQR